MAVSRPDFENIVQLIRGPIADPGPDILGLLSREAVAKIRYRQLAMEKTQLQARMDLIQVTMDALAAEHKIG